MMGNPPTPPQLPIFTNHRHTHRYTVTLYVEAVKAAEGQGVCMHSHNTLTQHTHTTQVYAITLYVEAEKAAKELGVRQRGGFFDDDSDDDYALAITDGAFNKALQVRPQILSVEVSNHRKCCLQQQRGRLCARAAPTAR